MKNGHVRESTDRVTESRIRFICICKNLVEWGRMRGVSPVALKEVSSSLKTMVAKMEGRLRTVNQLSESWSVDSLEVWAPSVDGGPQIEIPSGVVSACRAM